MGLWVLGSGLVHGIKVLIGARVSVVGALLFISFSFSLWFSFFIFIFSLREFGRFRGRL